MKENSVLEMKNIHKSFPGVRALQAVDLDVYKRQGLGNHEQLLADCEVYRRIVRSQMGA